MSLEVDGVWKGGLWASTVWADGVWREGPPVPPSDIGTVTASFKESGISVKYADNDITVQFKK